MNKRALVLAASLAIAGSALAGSVALAQDETDAPHPAHVHVGSCPAPGDVVGPLSDVSDQFLMDTTATATEPMGATTAIPVEASVTTAVAVPYADLFSSPHAIVVHKSAEEIGTYILCGDIGGPEMGATDIAVGLATLNDSGYTGIATIHDNGDGTIKVAIFMTEIADLMGGSTPGASMAPMGPSPSAAAS